MMALSPTDKRRVVASAALLRSDQDGEALAAVRAVCRQLDRYGLDPAAVLAAGLGGPPKLPPRRSEPPKPAEVLLPHQRTAMMAAAFPELLTEWEQEFVNSIAGRRSITGRQRDTLNAIASKVERGRK